MRLMKLAEKYHLPVVSLVDTPGAYPGLEAEARGQAEAIAKNLTVMATLRTPYVIVVTGEGGSGGALGSYQAGVFEGLRQLHRKIREEAQRRAAGRPERANDVKLSRGGIREIEFTVQLLQVVRGGQFPELRTRPTVDALGRISRAGLMPPATAAGLAQAYDFLRRVEHRIQYLDDQQTHLLPTQDADLAWIAATLGFAHTGAFLAELDGHRERVAEEFDKLLGGHADCVGCFKLDQSVPQDMAELLQREWKLAQVGSHQGPDILITQNRGQFGQGFVGGWRGRHRGNGTQWSGGRQTKNGCAERLTLVSRVLRQRRTGEPADLPLALPLGTDGFVELDRGLVPVEHGPLHPAATTLVGETRQVEQERLADAAAAELG
jgi:hypothetical protein